MKSGKGTLLDEAAVEFLINGRKEHDRMVTGITEPLTVERKKYY